MSKLGLDLSGVSSTAALEHAGRLKTELYKASRLLHEALEGRPGEKKDLVSQ